MESLETSGNDWKCPVDSCWLTFISALGIAMMRQNAWGKDGKIDGREDDGG